MINISRTILSFCFMLGCLNAAEQLSFRDQNYFIKEEYRSRTRYHHHDYTNLTDGSQREVYERAKQLFVDKDFFSVTDIGCGSAYKLMKYFSDFQTCGYEIEPTLSFLKTKYPERKWVYSDLSIDPEEIKVDLLICSDVIEHLVDPDRLLNRFDFKYLVISTPDRDKLLTVQSNPRSQIGPPINPAHVREWSFSELRDYISQYFDIVEHDHSTNEYWCQYIIARKKL